MKKTQISMIFGLILAFIMAISVASATQSFSVNPTSFSQTANVGSTGSGNITIINTGNQSIDYSLTKSNLVSGSKSITLTINTTSISGVAAGNSVLASFSYTSSSSDTTGTYRGNVTISNTADSSQKTVVPITVALQSSTGGEITFVNDDDGDNTFEMEGDVDEKIDEDIRLKNTGSIDLSNVRIKFEDLDGEEYGDQIDNKEIDVNDDSFDLDKGDSKTIEIEVDIPNDVRADVYTGKIFITTSQGYAVNYTLQVNVTAGDLDVEILSDGEDVRGEVLFIQGEAGELVDDFKFLIKNNGNIDVEKLKFDIEEDLQEEFTSNDIPTSAILFNPTSEDLKVRDDKDIEVKIQIPDDQATGTYFGDLRLLSSTGEELDKITIKVKVVGDIFIDKIEMNSDVTPGENLDVKVTVKNSASKLQRNVKVSGTLSNIDIANSDLTDTSSSFILDVKEEKTQLLRFKVPEDATDGSHTLELKVTFDDHELVEVEEIIVKRPSVNVQVESFAVNPSIIRCETTLYSFMKLKNLGKFDEDVVISAEVEGTDVKAKTNSFELNVDEVVQRNLAINIASLEKGIYTLKQRATYSGQYKESQTQFRIDGCNDELGVDVKPIDVDDNETQVGGNPGSGLNLFGQEVSKITAILGGGVIGVGALIVVLLFFL